MDVPFAALEWRATAMPGAATPVELARLPRLADGAFRAFVRFPAGWSRAEAGHYPVAEEFLVVEGDLQLNGATWEAGGYAWIPAFRARRDLGSRSGCLVFAWFGGPPDWRAGRAPANEPASGDRAFAHWREAPAIDGVHVLHEGPGHRSWVAQGGASGAAALEIMDWTTRRWRFGLPDAGCGPAFVRAMG